MNKLFTLLLLFFTCIGLAQETEVIQIPFTQTPNGHIMISAKVNGVEGQFIFDTGAGMNMLTQKFANQINDFQETDHFYTGHRATGEALQVDLWKANSLEINNFKYDNEVFSVYDIDFPLAGLISLTPFKNTPITIDFENNMLILETQNSMKEIVKNQQFEMPIQISNDRNLKITIATRIKLDNQLILDVNLDSGAGFDVYRFSSRYMEKLGIDKDSVKSKYIPSAFKPEEGNQYYLTTISKFSDINNNVRVKNFNATFIEGLIHEGIMGVNWIGKKFTIDLQNKRIIVSK